MIDDGRLEPDHALVLRSELSLEADAAEREGGGDCLEGGGGPIRRSPLAWRAWPPPRGSRKPGFSRETIVKKFLVAMLTIAALSGAVLVTHSSPAAAVPGGHGGGGDGGNAASTTANELNLVMN